MHASRESLIEFIQVRLKQVGLDMANASRAMGRNHAYLQQFFTRATGGIPEDSRQALSKVLQCEDDDLKIGPRQTTPMPPTGATARHPTQDHGPGLRLNAPMPVPDIDGLPRDVPVMGTAEAGPDGRFELNQGDAVDWIRRPPVLARVGKAYAIFCEGTSMLPVFEPGDPVYVHPSRPVSVGDYVLIQLKPAQDGESPPAFLKRLAKKTSDRIEVDQFNPKKTITFQASRIHEIHYVIRPNDLLKA